MLGRTFATGEDTPGSLRVAVLGWGLWRRAFGSDPDVVGTEISLDGDLAGDYGVANRRVIEERLAQAGFHMAQYLNELLK